MGSGWQVNMLSEEAIIRSEEEHLRLSREDIYCAITCRVAKLKLGVNYNTCTSCRQILCDNNSRRVSFFRERFIGYSLAALIRGHKAGRSKQQ